MFITELHGEMHVVTFCYIAASIVFLQCYSSTINQRTVWLIKKIKIIQTAVMLIQNDVQAVAPDGTLYPSVLICHPQLDILTWYFKTPPLGNGCGKHGAMNSIYWQIMQYMKAWALLFPLQTGLIFQLHHIVATLVQDILIESPQKQRFCSSYNEVQTFEWSSAVVQSTEFIQFAVNNANTT